MLSDIPDAVFFKALCSVLSRELLSHTCNLLTCNQTDDYHSGQLPRQQPAVYTDQNPILSVHRYFAELITPSYITQVSVLFFYIF